MPKGAAADFVSLQFLLPIWVKSSLFHLKMCMYCVGYLGWTRTDLRLRECLWKLQRSIALKNIGKKN